MPTARAIALVGDAPSLEDVFRDHAPFVLRTARRLGASARDAEDLAQQVFVVLHTRPELLVSSTSVRALLFGIVRRLVADHRKRERTRERLDTAAEDVEPVQERAVAQSQARALLDRALETLTAPQREVFVLYELEGMPMREVASFVGAPLQTAYARLHAARATVRLALQGKDLP